MNHNYQKTILEGKAVLGIEFGSTRIKAVLIDENHETIAIGTHDWENRLVNGSWTYTLDDIWSGLQECYGNLATDVKKKYNVEITTLSSIGFSAMMHGYLTFDKDDNLLVPFRTWRNTTTAQASAILTEKFSFNIPQRWSISHLYQAILNKEEHVKSISFLTTLAGYIHYKLTDEKVLGIGDASGMFPIDSDTKNYDSKMIDIFNKLVKNENLDWNVEELFPKCLAAGEYAGKLTEEGARLLDVSGKLEAGILLCPPEGDAGTGMVATNAVAEGTGNVSAGTSIFSMIVTENKLKSIHKEIDMVTTPDGKPVAMVHCNNCTSDLNAWVSLFKEFAVALSTKIDMDDLYGTLYNKALEGDADCGGVMAFNYSSGEPVTGFSEGRPMFMRKPNANFNLANFMRAHLMSSLAAIKIGNDILIKEEGVNIEHIMGHGGLFKTPIVGQRLLAAALDTAVTVMDTASEGGPWGMAVLAAYMVNKSENQSLSDYLNNKVFEGKIGTTVEPSSKDVKGFDIFAESYKNCFMAEHAAIDNWK
ncbi:ATPase [bacterium D16-51]|nr:ATPase [bacterium D16-59]RKI62867.1 ATPase [bacterium D16-51]